MFSHRSITSDALVNLLVLYEVGFLPEGFGANLAPERLLAGVRTKVDLDVALVQKATIADGAAVNRLLLPEQPAEVGRR